MRWLGHVLRIKNDGLSKIALVGQLSRAKQKAGHPRKKLEDIVKKDLREIELPWEGVKRKALDKMGWRTSEHIYVGLRRLGAAIELVVLVVL